MAWNQFCITSSVWIEWIHRKSDCGLQEWGIVELQGDLEVRGEEMMENQFIGDLNYDKYGQPVSIQFQWLIVYQK